MIKKILAQSKYKLIDYLKAQYNCLDWQTNNILKIILVDNGLIFIGRFHGNKPFGTIKLLL
jgi:hypothetical protein